MKLYIERRHGTIHVQQKVDSHWWRAHMFRTLKSVKDTPDNFADILRWANAVGHTLEERRGD